MKCLNVIKFKCLPILVKFLDIGSFSDITYSHVITQFSSASSYNSHGGVVLDHLRISLKFCFIQDNIS